MQWFVCHQFQSSPDRWCPSFKFSSQDLSRDLALASSHPPKCSKFRHSSLNVESSLNLQAFCIVWWVLLLVSMIYGSLSLLRELALSHGAHLQWRDSCGFTEVVMDSIPNVSQLFLSDYLGWVAVSTAIILTWQQLRSLGFFQPQQGK